MYSKFENNKTKNLKFTDIYKLVEPIKKLEESKWLPDIYFIGKTLKEYADLPSDYEIKAFIEHATQLSDYTEGGFRVHPSLPSIVPSQFRVSIIEGVTGNNGAYAVGPYIAYAKSALSKEKLEFEKERLGRNLLVFPAHSIRGLKASYNIDTFCEKIKDIAKQYDSVRICLYWKDVILGRADNYKKHGFEVVTAGHYYDPMFMPRLKSIIETSTMTMSNKLGTYVGYCIFLNKPHYLLKSRVEMDKIISDGKESAEIEYNVSRNMRKRLKNQNINLIFELLSKNQEIITEDQYNHLNKYWGFDQIKTPKKLRKLLLEIEGEYQIKTDDIKLLKKDIRDKNDAIKRRDELIRNRDEIIREKNDIIRNRDNIIREKINIVQNNNKIILEKNDVIRNRDNEINKIINSNSWKVTRYFRKIFSWIR
jgi:hypothetical protein